MAAQSDGDRDLIERRENIRLLNDETSMKLKKQVYLNYRQVCFLKIGLNPAAADKETSAASITGKYASWLK